MPRITKAPQDRRKEILETAMELFLKSGYEGTSVSDIVNRLGVAQGLFYYYFTSKEEVYRAAMEWYTDEFAEKLQEIILDRSLPLFKKLEQILETMNGMIAESEHALMDSLRLAEHLELDNRLSMHVAQSLVDPLTTLLTELNEQGSIRIESPEFTATFLIFGIYGLVHGTQDRLHNLDHLNSSEIGNLLARVLGVDVETLSDL